MSVLGPLSTTLAPPAPTALAGVLAPVLCTLPLAPAFVVPLPFEKGTTVAVELESSL
jgi:hypothetical protein